MEILFVDSRGSKCVIQITDMNKRTVHSERKWPMLKAKIEEAQAEFKNGVPEAAISRRRNAATRRSSFNGSRGFAKPTCKRSRKCFLSL